MLKLCCAKTLCQASVQSKICYGGKQEYKCVERSEPSSPVCSFRPVVPKLVRVVTQIKVAILCLITLRREKNNLRREKNNLRREKNNLGREKNATSLFVFILFSLLFSKFI